MKSYNVPYPLPENNMENKELQLILASAVLHPTEAELQGIDALIPVIDDWNKLALLLIDRGTAPLLYNILNKEQSAKNKELRDKNNEQRTKTIDNIDLVPAAVLNKLRNAYYKTLSRNTLIYQEFVLLSEILQENSIPFITLKGICMAEWLYTDIGLRQMSDIDILIQEKDGLRCLDALHAAGYVSQQEFTVDEFVDSKSQNHYNPLFRNDVMVEIHIRLQNTREIYQQNLQEVWRDAVPVTLNGMETLRLELSDMLIHACLHLDKHFVTTHVQFTSFNDIVNLIREIPPLPGPLQGERETANLQVVAKLEVSEKENIQKKSILDIEKSIYHTELSTETLTPSPTGEGWGEVFWERFEAKCIQYNFADTVFTYLIVVAHYYKAPLPQHLVEKYDSLLTEVVKNRFENFLAGTGNEFIGRGAPRSNTATHMLHLKQLKNLIDFLRYVKGVVFPGKAFMIEKYGLREEVCSPVTRDVGILHLRSTAPLHGMSEYFICSEEEVGSRQFAVKRKRTGN